MMLKPLPFEEQLKQIGDAAVEELEHKHFVAIVDREMAQLDQLEQDLDDVIYLREVHEAILLKGVTPSIFTDYGDRLWNRHEFDLEPFVNGSNEQLEYCIEGLGVVVSRILDRIYEVLNSIIRWFTTDSFFQAWLNKMVFYHRQVEQLYSMYSGVGVVSHAFDQQLITGYNYPTYFKMLSGIATFIVELQNIRVPKDVSAFDKPHSERFNQAMATFGYVTDGTTVYSTGENIYRRETARIMEWTPNKVLAIKNDLVNYVLKQGSDLGRLKYALVQAAIDWSREIDKIRSSGNIDQLKLNDAQTMKNGCLLIKRTVKLTMQVSSGLAAQWCQMIRLFPACSVSSTYTRV